MSIGRIEIEGQSGTFVSGTRAKWLIAARRAQLLQTGTLQLIDRPHDANGLRAGRFAARHQWTAYSGTGVGIGEHFKTLRGYHMNGDLINHG